METKSWTPEEISILQQNINKNFLEIQQLLFREGFSRSTESIRKKRKRVGQEPVEEVAENSLRQKEVFQRTLVVGDTHIYPGQNVDRFTALGKFVKDKKPNNIIFMGDIGDFDSLSAWDSGKEASHGKKYKDDIKACKHALKLFLDNAKCEGYSPRIIVLGGNHCEFRIERYIETHPQLRGHMDLADDLELEELGIEYVNYRKFLEIDNVLFSHAVMTAANQPASSKNVMNVISTLTAKSVVVGHHHRFETANFMRHGAVDVQQILLAGLFSEDTPDYADGACNSYVRCIVQLTHLSPGRFDIEQIGLERLKAEYL